MTRGALDHVRAFGLMLCLGGSILSPLRAQTDQSQEAQLLGKAHALEMRGRMDMAKQVWQQVLHADSNQPDALAGMARANKLEGHPREAEEYLNRLRAVNPNDPNIQRIETMGTAQDEAGKLQEAGRLAQAGQYERAMGILRDVYGTNPPPGDAALSYYQTEAATEEGRPHAIAGLRSMIDKYPQDSRYQVALGKILTYNPRTRAEGRKLLEKHPYDPDAQEALRKSLEWDQKSPGTAPDIKAYLEHHRDAQLSGALQADQTQTRRGGKPAAPATAEERAAAQSRNAAQRAAYAALNAKHLADAEARFNALLEKNPHDSQSAAGMGYVRMNQSKFDAAITYFERAEEDGDKSQAIERALRDSRFYFTMQTATAALNENNLPVAEQQFRAALTMRQNDPTALLGLGGTLLKGQQNDRAVEVFATDVHVAPNDKGAWRGLLMAEYGAGKYSDALATDKLVPPSVKKELLRDPDYLRTLASVDLALGHDAEAQRVFHTALELPFPSNGAGLKVGVELQYAALLSTADHKEQAIGLYKQVLASEPGNVNALIGLVQNEHQLGQDAAAYDVIRTMPAPAYTAAMQEAGFETTVAAVYEGQGHDDLAQQVLEQFLANQQAQGKQPFAPAEIQLAGIYMRRGDSVRAYSLYKSLLESSGSSADAWNGLLGALHATGHDQEALSELQTIPPATRKDLENNPGYLQTVGSIYASLGDSQDALRFFNRVQEHYDSERVRPPAELEVQQAWLLYNSHSDQALLQHLLTLGDRKDLTDQQRLTVQTIWANFAVRRANQASAAGNYRLAIAILNAAAQSFPNNHEVLRALATGYASAGMPREAVAIFKAQDLNTGSAGDYRAAVGAALAASDQRDAEIWLRFGLDQYPRDPQMLMLAGRFEAARGDANRAAEYYRAALAAMPPGNPGAQLASAMAQPAPQSMAGLPSRQMPQDLAALLSQPDTAGMPGRQPAMQIRPYLPSYSGGTGTMPVPTNEGAAYGTNGYGNAQPSGAQPSVQSVLPSGASGAATDAASGYLPGGAGVTGATAGSDLGGYPPTVPVAQPPSDPTAKPHTTTLEEYTPTAPKSRVEPAEKRTDTVLLASAQPVLRLHADMAAEAKYGPYVSYNPSAGVPHFVGARTGLGDGVVMMAQPEGSVVTARFVSALAHVQRSEAAVLRTVSFQEPQQLARSQEAQPTQVSEQSPAAQAQAPTEPVTTDQAPVQQTSAPQTEPQAVQAQSQQVSPQPADAQQPQPMRQPTVDDAPMFSPRPSPSGAVQTSADGTPIVPYAATAHAVSKTAARKQQTVTHTPSAAVQERAAAIRENQAAATPQMTGVSRPPVESYDTAPTAALNDAQYTTSGQYGAGPAQGQTGQPNGTVQQGGYSSSAPQYGSQPQQNGDSNGQQYPQPGTRTAGSPTTGGTHRGRRKQPKPAPAPSSAAEATPAPAVTPQQPAMQYPVVGQPLENMGPPPVGAPYPLGQAPSDYQLQQHNLPPLRAYFDPRTDQRRPLTEREQAELDLAQIEGGYSNWLGASVIGRYRSGTPGIDRLASLEVPFEASFVFNNQFRLSIIPKAVFLNSGTLNTNGGTLGTGPVLGTYLASAPNNPSQQFANGVGGEVQLATNTIDVAVGTTPYEFLVTNLIGRGRWRPGNGHFTLYGGRDAVEETQLSYAGLRDPGTATTTYGGNVWGGVVLSGGGARFDMGDERSGLYAQAEGGALTGYHVLQNQKVDGLVGAYFRVKQWPEYGTLNIGGTFYGMHFSHNERGETYGLGGYFSPEAYFLAAVPVTYSGHYGTDLHYTINGSLGVQTFQEDNETYFPLDPSLLAVAGCTSAQFINHTCGLPVNSNTGLNFSFDTEVSYRVNEHWYVGGFLSANNTNNYDTVQGGFFARYTFRPQYPTAEYPTGLFPVQGFRPLRVP